MIKTQPETLASLLQNMPPEDYGEIRDAYYKAVEGLQTLAKGLEWADAKQPKIAGPLLDEHFIAATAIEAMKKSELGRIL